jgi:SAM-dependent methyltransferase
MASLPSLKVTKKMEKPFNLNPSEKKNSSWEEYYRNKLTNRGWSYSYYHRRRIEENLPYYNEIFSCAKKNDKPVLVVGVGAGTDSIEIARHGFNVLGIDSEFLFNFSRENINKFDPLLTIGFFNADMCHLPFINDSFQLVTSMGVLEHYPSTVIKKALQEALRTANTYIFMVPTDICTPINMIKLGLISKSPIMGDENFLNVTEWEQIIIDSGARIEKKMGYWDPKLGSTFLHPKEPEKCYGKGFFAIYRVTS